MGSEMCIRDSDQTLPQPYQTRHTNQKRHHKPSPTTPIRLRRAMPPIHRHAQCYKQVPHHFRVTREHIRQEYISEFTIIRFCKAAEGYAAEGFEEAKAPVVGDAERCDKGDE